MKKDGSVNPSGSARSSSRLGVRKVKESAQSSRRAEPAAQKKRKSVMFEDDPDYSECEDDCAILGNIKKVPGYRCSPHLVPELFAQLSPKQKGWVRNIDFHSLEGMIDSRMTKSLTMWLVDQVDTDNGTIDVCGTPISIRDGVVRLLKLPTGDIKVPPPLNGRSKAKRPKGDTARPDMKHSDNGRGQTAKDAMKSLIAEEVDEEEFCRSFVMLVLCIYLAPTTSLNINRSYYTSLLDVSSIRLMDWCGFIADYLIQGIAEYRGSKASHVQVPGCVHVLPLLYLDALLEMKALKLPDSLPLPEAEPRIHFIGTAHLDYLASVDLKSRCKDHVEYGKLQVKTLAYNRACERSKNSAGSSKQADPMQKTFNGIDSNRNAEDKNQSPAHNILVELYTEIKESRDLLMQDFREKMEASDMKIFNRFAQKFGEQTKTAVNIPEKQEKNGGSGPQDNYVENIIVSGPNVNCSSSAPSTINSKRRQSVCPEKVVEEISDPGNYCNIVHKVPCQNLEPDNLNPATTPDGVSSEKIPPLHAQKNASTVVCNDSSLDTVVEDVPSPVVRQQQKEPASFCFTGENAKADLCNEDMVDVVKIGLEAAMEANLFQDNDKFKNIGGVRLSCLADAAAADCIAKFDQTPTAGMRSVSPVFVENYAATESLSSAQCVKGPALFDKSPTTPSFVCINSTMKRTSFQPIPECSSPTEGDVYAPFPNSLLRAAREGEGSEKTPEESRNAEAFPDCLFRAPVHGDISGQVFGEVSCRQPSHQNAIPGVHADLNASGEADKTLVSHDTDSEDSETETESHGDGHDLEHSVSEDEEMEFVSNTDFIPTPSYTFDSQEIIQIPDNPVSPPPNDIQDVPPVQAEIVNGCRFRYGCSVSTATFKLYDRFKNFEPNSPRLPEPTNFRLVLCKEASETYKVHVLNSSAKISTRYRKSISSNRGRTKIQIKRFHVTKGEFVDALKPNGEVCRNMMGLCSVALMSDWENEKRIILDQATIMELMKPGHECDQKLVAGRLRKMRIEEVENIYIPILTEEHWILAVVNILTEVVEFYDSLLRVRAGENPHQKVWDNLAGNLEDAYCMARKRSIHITFFGFTYGDNALQTNTHDCGFHVIQTMECHKIGDVVGYSKKKTMLPYRKYLSHVLIYHRFNDLNPLRIGLQEQVP